MRRKVRQIRYAITAREHCRIIGAVTNPDDRTRLPVSREKSDSGWLTSSDAINHGRFAPGTILADRYRITGLLGQGGMGEVYRADDLKLGQQVALKFLPRNLAHDVTRLARFHSEVRLSRQISHPNVCRVYDVGEVDGDTFLSMEYIDGEHLSSLLRRIGRLPEDRATEMARQLCAGVAAAHARGVLHRDLKPANVMIDGRGSVRVLDFGLAVATGTTELDRAGTPAYMAPEQLSGGEITPQSDIYALGLVLYEMFTGRRAHNPENVADLIRMHESDTKTRPTAVVPGLDPAIERAIMRCLERDPARRPSSAIAVSAALPGGDPLAAALAAGETPSPAMVAAAGEGVALSQGAAIALVATVLVGMAAAYSMGAISNPLERMQSEYNADVLAQKARDAIRQLGYVNRPADEAYGFAWDATLIEHRDDTGQRRWHDRLGERPSPLMFWYRRSDEPMIALTFHHDLLTPGLVKPDDPPPIVAGMIGLTLDHQGFLTSFEAIPSQVSETVTEAAAPDWSPLLALSGLEGATLQPSAPQWHWLAAADTRSAWTGTWPNPRWPLRVESAALQGRPVAFQVIGPWTKPWRTPSSDTGGTAVLIVLCVFAFLIIGGGAFLAVRNLREGRGDRQGAINLAAAAVGALWALWICHVHFVPAIGTVALLLLAVVTTVFYGVLFWAIYLALEPFVRRHWPQTLVSWTTILNRRLRDPVVGRDVLVGALLGVSVAVLIRLTTLYSDEPAWIEPDLLLGTRAIVGVIIMQLINSVRSALFFFFLLFLLRVLLRNQWAAAVAFALIFALLEAAASGQPLIHAVTALVYFSTLALAVLRWGLTTLAVAMFVANLLLMAPATTRLSAWYVESTFLIIGTALAVAAWAFYACLAPPRLRTSYAAVR
jgi:serine/threonine-protein kinase